MVPPPISPLTPWLPGHWITQTGYALNENDLIAGTKNVPEQCMDMRSSVSEVGLIMEKVMRK